MSNDVQTDLAGLQDALLKMGRRVGDPTRAPADPHVTQFLQRLREALSPDRPAVPVPDSQPDQDGPTTICGGCLTHPFTSRTR